MDNKFLFAGAACIAMAAIYYFKKIAALKHIQTMKVLTVDIKPLAHIKDEALIHGLFVKACEAFQRYLLGKKANHEHASTAYSLYKQIKEGDADEFEKNKTTCPPEKYNVWI